MHSEFMMESRFKRIIAFLMETRMANLRIFQVDEFLHLIDLANRDCPNRSRNDRYLAFRDFAIALTRPRIATIFAEQLRQRFYNEFGGVLRKPDWVMGHGFVAQPLADYLTCAYWPAGQKLYGLAWADMAPGNQYVLQAEDMMDWDTPVCASEKVAYLAGAMREARACSVLSILKPSELVRLGAARIISLFDVKNVSSEGFEIIPEGATEVVVREESA